MLNKQQPFGADVISRISATMLDPEALGKLQQLAQETLGQLAAEVCAEGGVDPTEIYEVAIAGNATMTQILLGIDPEALGVAPFILASESYPSLLASEMGFDLNPRARGFLFPALGAYVGGDIIAGALATGMDRDKRLRLFIDIGTNCELILGDGERMIATAAPAGPAFEAASIRCGMRAAPGAIEVVTVDEQDVRLQVIGDVEPTGLCGSGLVDAVAELVRIGIIDGSGRFISDEQAAARLPGWPADCARRTASASSCSRTRPTRLRRCTSASATSESSSSRRPPSRPAGSCSSRSSAWSRRTSSRSCSRAPSARTCRPATPSASGSCPASPPCAIVSAGNVAGEGAKMALAVRP